MVEYRNSETSRSSLAHASDRATQSEFKAPRFAAHEENVVARLKDAALTLDRADAPSALEIVNETGVSAEMLADYYIPIVARDLGNEWCIDQISFADVTIGVARLQSMLRELGPEWTSQQNMQGDASTVLLLVADGAHHTLGALVLSGQLRRHGLSVRLLLGATPHGIHELFEVNKFDAVFISSCAGESLESLRKIVESVRAVATTVPPVVIGGTLLETEQNVVALTGADFVTSTAKEAITFCSLKTNIHNNTTLGR